MIITESFAWAHLPKAAGTATHDMLLAVDGLIDFRIPADSNDKHESFASHRQAIEGKLLVVNIRRLPSWVLSMAQHRAVHGIAPRFEPIPVPGAEELIEDDTPDRVLEWTTGGEGFPIDRWLRAESLAADVEALLLEAGISPRRARSAVRSVPWKAKPYDHDVSSVFSPADVRRLYERNPGWSRAETVAYGGIPDPAGDAAAAPRG